jgi:hypothetical protein
MDENRENANQPVRLSGGCWLVLIRSERKVCSFVWWLLAGADSF